MYIPFFFKKIRLRRFIMLLLKITKILLTLLIKNVDAQRTIFSLCVFRIDFCHFLIIFGEKFSRKQVADEIKRLEVAKRKLEEKKERESAAIDSSIAEIRNKCKK